MAGPDTAEQVLIEFGRLQAENQRLHEQLNSAARAEQAAKEEERLRNEESLRPVCRLRWIKQPQNGGCLVGGRSYRGRGPGKDRITGQTTQLGSEFDAPADDARVLEESGYAEITRGREHVLAWDDPTPLGPGQARKTRPVRVDPDAAPPPAAGDADRWEALVVYG